jgi:DNA-directed RNA polymerase
VQRVPWAINEFMVPVVEKFACEVKPKTGDAAERFKAELGKDIKLARHLAGQPFWTPYNIDFRGRLYPTPHFNIGRQDHVRSLFLFSNGQNVGDSVDWIEIAVANAAGQIKGKSPTWRDRHDWVAKHLDPIRRTAANPDETFKEWKKFKDLFQFVAACREFVEAQNNPNFVTRLPIFLDGSANGIQHLACMSRDEESGKLVNLTNSDDRYDIYDVISKEVKKRLEAAGDEHAEWWLSPERLTRELFKRPVLSFSYGVTGYGIRGQITEVYKEKHGKAPPDSHVKYLADLIFEATKERLKRPHKVMEFIRDLTRLRASRNLPLEWETPSGLPVSNRYYESNMKTVELKLQGRRVEHLVADGWKDTIIEKDAKNGAPANFVHSMDAAHLALSVNAAVSDRDPIVDVAVVHDCFAAPAPQVQRFQKIPPTTGADVSLLPCTSPFAGRLRAGAGEPRSPRNGKSRRD